MGNGLRILLLGSYDPVTKDILHRLRLDLNQWFERYSCTTLLLDNLEIHISLSPSANDYSLFFETEGKAGVVWLSKTKPNPLKE